jgi:hypothetical protein
MDRFGLLRMLGFFGTRPAPRQLSPEERISWLLRGQRTSFEASAAEACAATSGGAIVPELGTGDPEIDNAARAAGSLGDRPLIVLTAGKYIAPSDPTEVPEAAAYHDFWVHHLQADLVRLSTRGKQLVVENSDHGIPSEAPEAVVSAVEEVVTEVRSAPSSGTGIR